MVEFSTIRKLSRRIVHEFHPQRIILFGSYAYGRPTWDSDVDLLIVMRFKGHSAYQAARIRERTRPEFPVDLIVRTPRELRGRVKSGDFFMQEILKKGRVIHEASHA